jgi:hypothetical protein
MSLWWDSLQLDGHIRGREKIKTWDIMVAKIKGKFLSTDFSLDLFKRLQNLSHEELSMKEYTKAFYKLTVSVGHI